MCTYWTHSYHSMHLNRVPCWFFQSEWLTRPRNLTGYVKGKLTSQKHSQHVRPSSPLINTCTCGSKWKVKQIYRRRGRSPTSAEGCSVLIGPILPESIAVLKCLKLPNASNVLSPNETPLSRVKIDCGSSVKLLLLTVWWQERRKWKVVTKKTEKHEFILNQYSIVYTIVL